MTIISNLIKTATQTLKNAGIKTASLDAKLILEHVSGGIARSATLLRDPDLELTPEIQASFQNLIQKRATRIPLSHLTNRQDFFNLTFEVTPDTLIPRPDSETLVEWALETCQKTNPKTVAEIGTGSGCLIISLAKNFPTADFHATDISQPALKIATKNATTHQTPIIFHQGNLADPLPNNLDLIISNPPYLTSTDMQNLQAEVQHDPKLALDGGETGLDFFQQILQSLKPKLSKTAIIIFEHAPDQAQKITEFAKAIFPNCQTDTKADLTGKPRCTKITLS